MLMKLLLFSFSIFIIAMGMNIRKKRGLESDIMEQFENICSQCI